MTRVDIINGPNLNLLGSREHEVYGHQSLEDIARACNVAFPDVDLHFFQSNIEGEIIDALQKSTAKAIVINPGGYTHTSVAIRDAIATMRIPVVECHISNIAGRESFRHESLISPVCTGVIMGFGTDGYLLSIHAALHVLNTK